MLISNCYLLATGVLLVFRVCSDQALAFVWEVEASGIDHLEFFMLGRLQFRS